MVGFDIDFVEWIKRMYASESEPSDLVPVARRWPFSRMYRVHSPGKVLS